MEMTMTNPHGQDAVKHLENYSQMDGHKIRKVSSIVQQRYVLVLLTFFGFLMVYSMRVNINVAIVDMVKQTESTKASASCVALTEPSTNNFSNATAIATNKKNGAFDWSPYTQGIILGSFFYGYIITPIPGGRLSERYGAKWLFGTGVFITGLLSFFIPAAANYGGSVGLILIRVLQGIGEGVSYPAAEALAAHWIPVGERTTCFALMHSGSFMGVVLGLGLSGILIESGIFGGWPAVFYCFGLLTTIWYIVWGICIASKPDNHPWISQEELDFINNDMKNQKPTYVWYSIKLMISFFFFFWFINVHYYKATKTPWKKIFASLPVYATVVGLFGSNWLHYLMIIELPTYLGTVLNFNIQDNGLSSALPYVGAAVAAILTAPLADYLRTRRILNITSIRKIFHAFAHIVPCIFISITPWIAGCDGFLTLVLFVIGGSIRACSEASVMSIPVDMTPDYAGTIMGIMTSLGNTPGIFVPWITGMFINEENSLIMWTYNFYLAVAVSLFCTVFFLIFASAEVQDWGLASTENRENEEEN